MSKLPCPELGFQKNETGCWEMEPEGEHVAEVRPGAGTGTQAGQRQGPVS